MTIIRKSSDTQSPRLRSLTGPADTTSCQILLSRGVSDLSEPIGIKANTEAPRGDIVSIFESSTHHIMTLGEPANLVGATLASANAGIGSSEYITS